MQKEIIIRIRIISSRKYLFIKTKILIIAIGQSRRRKLLIDAHRTSWRLDQGPKTLSMAKSNIFLMHWHCHRITPQLNELVSHTSLSLLITSSPSRLSDQIATEAIHATPSMEKAPNAASSAKWTPSTLPPTPRLRSPFWEDSKFCPRSSRISIFLGIRLHFFRTLKKL